MRLWLLIFSVILMYKIHIEPTLQASLSGVLDQYNALIEGRPNLFGAEGATAELNEVWNQLSPGTMKKPGLSIDFDSPVTRSQLIGLVKALEVAVFIGDGRYSSLLDHIHPVLERHANAYLLRQSFVLAEQSFADLGLKKSVSADFRSIAGLLRDAFGSVTGPMLPNGHLEAPGITIEKHAVSQEAVFACP